MHHRATNPTKPIHINKKQLPPPPPIPNAVQQQQDITNGGPLDALPQQFVRSMKTLFDILDDKNTGYINLADIEKRWEDDGSKGLPNGVIESLKKVANSNGDLTFERFCAGLKISLLRNQPISLSNSLKSVNTNNGITNVNGLITMSESIKKNRRLSSDNILDCIPTNIKSDYISKAPMRPPSTPILNIDSIKQWNPNNTTNNANTAAIRPNNVAMQQNQRTLSLPQLSPGSDIDMMIPDDSTTSDENSTTSILYHQNIYSTGAQQLLSPPPKPPRSAILHPSTNNQISLGGISCSSNSGNSIDKIEIRHALQNWQMGILMNEMETKEKRVNYNRISARSSGDGGSLNGDNSNNSLMNMSSPSSTLYQKKPLSAKRREPRRHTLQNAIDYNLLKRLKQYEEERDVLLQGLRGVDQARDWYLQQLANIQEKIKYLGKMGSHVEHWSEAQQERLDFQRARVLEINRHLSALQWERNNFPMHMNLAVRRH